MLNDGVPGDRATLVVESPPRLAGEPARGEFLCSRCGYGVSVRDALPICPMCSGGEWEAPLWRALASPFH